MTSTVFICLAYYKIIKKIYVKGLYNTFIALEINSYFMSQFQWL